jgi:UDP-N-acetylmuramate: L-alanyl-gamma-D-glutamyl-meso-diaminopimelate ligase
MKIHLIGIAGTGMGSFAGLLHAAGHEVRGSDTAFWPPMGELLERWRVPRMQGFRAEHLDWGPDVVVVGNVCRRDNPEAVAAVARGLTRTSFPRALSDLFLGPPRRPLVVAGTHGKTTTSALAAWSLVDAGLDPGFLIGGEALNFHSSFGAGRGAPFVVEGDEYDTAFFDKGPKLLHYRPHVAILTSVEYDHADIYLDLVHVAYAFRRFLRLVPRDGRVVACADFPLALQIAREEAACEVVTYATGDARDVEVARDGTRFTLDATRYHLPMWGEHNVLNAVAVVRAAEAYGVSREALVRAFGRFAGVRRRQEVRGVARGVTVIDDFAHHPTAVRVTIDAVRAGFAQDGGRVIAVFEPRSATAARKVFEEDFGHALGRADAAFVARSGRHGQLGAEQAIDPERVAALARGHYVPDVPQIVEHVVRVARPGDAVLVMSNGDFGGIHGRLLEALAAS